MNLRLLLILCIVLLLLTACGAPATVEPTQSSPIDNAPEQATATPEIPTAIITTEEPSAPTDEASAPFELTSSAFSYGESIPVKYSCDGDDISPSLTWGDPPEGAQSLALIMDDPDAPVGTWDHWTLFNISTDTRELPEAMTSGVVPATFGKNSWSRNDYGGPCPPGGTHRYFLRLYALDTTLSLDENADKNQVLSAMDGHILAESELMGTFTR